MRKTCLICHTVFETNYKTLYDTPECRKIAKDRRDKNHKKVSRQKIREEQKQNQKKACTLCTCPTCGTHHIKPGKYDSSSVFCDNCRVQNSEIMSGFMGDFYE